MADLLTKCQMCQKFDMVPAKTKEGNSLDYVLCPNCDDPKGESPPL